MEDIKGEGIGNHGRKFVPLVKMLVEAREGFRRAHFGTAPQSMAQEMADKIESTLRDFVSPHW